MSELVPRLRFEHFSSIWKKEVYGNIYSFNSTNSLSRENLNYVSGSVMNIHYGDIHTKFSTIFNLNREVVPFVNEDIDLSKIKSESYCQEGDLVIADASENYNDIGKTIEIKCLHGKPTIAGLHTFLARPAPNTMAIGFAGYLMQSWSVRKQVMIIAQGTKVLGISTNRLKNITLTIPHYKEQQKIADFLTSVDTKISQLTEKHRLLQEYKKGVMQQIFSQQIRFKDENGEAFPEWEEKYFHQAFERRTKKNKENNLNVLTISAQQGLVSQLDYFNKSVSAKDLTGYYLLERGDFAYNKSYSKGYPMGAIKPLKLYDKGVVSTLYICFKAKENSHPEFFEQFFNGGMLNHEIAKIAQEGARNHGLLNVSVKEFFEDIKLNFPSLAEQQKIAQYLQAIDQKIAAVAEQVEQSKQFKKGLLQQMFV